jgi:hypothetical protein
VHFPSQAAGPLSLDKNVHCALLHPLEAGYGVIPGDERTEQYNRMAPMVTATDLSNWKDCVSARNTDITRRAVPFERRQVRKDLFFVVQEEELIDVHGASVTIIERACSVSKAARIGAKEWRRYTFGPFAGSCRVNNHHVDSPRSEAKER